MWALSFECTITYENEHAIVTQQLSDDKDQSTQPFRKTGSTTAELELYSDMPARPATRLDTRGFGPVSGSLLERRWQLRRNGSATVSATALHERLWSVPPVSILYAL